VKTNSKYLKTFAQVLIQEIYKTSFQDYVDFVDSIGYKFEMVVKDLNYLILPGE